MNGDEVRAARFRGGNAGSYVGVDDLLRRLAAELDARRAVGPLIKNAEFRRLQRPFAKGYDVDAVDWFLDQIVFRLDRSGLAGIGTDPWHDLDVTQLVRSEVSGPATPQPAWRGWLLRSSSRRSARTRGVTSARRQARPYGGDGRHERAGSCARPRHTRR